MGLDFIFMIATSLHDPHINNNSPQKEKKLTSFCVIVTGSNQNEQLKLVWFKGKTHVEFFTVLSTSYPLLGLTTPCTPPG